MTDTAKSDVAGAAQDAPPRRAAPARPPSRPSETERGPVVRVALAVACALLGFLLVAQVQANEGLGERLEAEREEDLTRILSDLSDQNDRLQREITDLRITLLEFESSAENEELALSSLASRLDDLRILAGVVAAEGEGVVMEIADPSSQVTSTVLVDTIQELRDAGAEAIAINDVRLVASSAIQELNDRLVVDGQPLDQPLRITAVGPADTMATALQFPAGAVDNLTPLPDVTVTVETRSQLTVPARPEPVPFVYGEPAPSPETG